MDLLRDWKDAQGDAARFKYTVHVLKKEHQKGKFIAGNVTDLKCGITSANLFSMRSPSCGI